MAKMDTIKITGGTSTARHDPVCMRMHMRHERAVRAISSFNEERSACYEVEHGVFLVGIRHAGCRKEGSGNDIDRVQLDLLGLDGACASIESARHQAANGAEDDVQ